MATTGGGGMRGRVTGKILFGASNALRAADRLEKATERLSAMLAKAEQAKSTANRITGGGTSMVGNPTKGWNSGSNWSQGRPVGGGARFTGGKFRRAAPMANGVGSGGGGGGGFRGGAGSATSGGGIPGAGGGDGGGGGFLSQMAGSLDSTGITGKLMDMGVGYGKKHMAEQLSMDSYLSSASMSGDKGQLRRQIFGDNGRDIPSVGFNIQDTLRGEQMRRQIAGSPFGSGPASTARSRAAFTDYMGISYANPEASATQVAAFQQQLAQPGVTFGLAAAGIVPKGGGQLGSAMDVHNAIMKVAGGGKGTLTQMEQTFSQGGYADMLTTQWGLDGDMQREYSRAANKARKEGVSDEDFTKTMEKAATDDKDAQAKANKWGIGKAGLRKVKRLNSTRQSRQADINDEFMEAVKGAAQVVEQFEKALTNILNLPIIRQVVAASGGGAVLDSTGPGAIGAGLLKGGLGLGGGPVGAAIGVGKAIFGGLFGGKSCDAAGAVRFAKSKLGGPYVWGGNGPKGYDCSGLTLASYKSIGINLGARVAVNQYHRGKGRKLKKSEKLQAGDLLFPHAGHTAIYAGGGKVYEAKGRAYGIVTSKLSAKNWRGLGAKRVCDTVSGNLDGGVGADQNSKGDPKQDQSSGSGGDVGEVGSGGVGSRYGSVEETESISAALAGDGGLPGYSEGGSGSGSAMENGSGADGGEEGGGTGGGAGAHCKLSDKKCLKNLAKGVASKHGWGSGAQWEALDWLVNKESSWNPKAKNPSSGAYGLPQSLPGSKMASVGKDWRTNPATQLKWMMRYIKGRYGSPVKAQNFHRGHNWYEQGAWNVRGNERASLHKGEMVLPVQPAEKVREAMARETLFSFGRSGTGDDGAETAVRYARGFVVADVSGSATSPQHTRNTALELSRYLAREQLYEEIAAGGEHVH